MNSRAVAAQIIAAVITENKSLTDCLSVYADVFKDARDNAFLQALCYGVCRWYYLLEEIVEKLLDKPLKQKDSDIFALLLMGLYQLRDMRVPEHAAVAATVAATQDLNKPWAKGLVNAILRNYLRHKEAIENEISAEAKFSHPVWFVKRIQEIYPNQWKSIIEANNQHPPFSLRINEQLVTRAHYLKMLQEKGIEASELAETQSGIILHQPIDVQQLPGFADGQVSVQDGAAQLAATLLKLEPGQHVLDACAAPGGKTAHILELQSSVICTAVDRDAKRVELIKDNLTRLNLSAQVIVADAANVESWWDGVLFDRILLDAPCSASGIIRRHPEIKLLRHPDDIKQLAFEQLRLLNALWTVLKKGGLLLYATCSIFPEENTEIIEQFMQTHAEAISEPLSIQIGIKDQVGGQQILPATDSMDGFYYACLRK